MKNALISILNGFSQVVFQESPLSGLLIFIAILLYSPTMLVGGVVGAIVGWNWCIVRRVKLRGLNSGALMFNSILTGLSIAFYMPFDMWMIVYVFVGAIVAFEMYHLAWTRKIRVFTFPYIVVTWMAIILYHWTTNGIVFFRNQPMPVSYEFLFPFRAFGQIYFVEGWMSGFLIFMSIAITRLKYALLCLGSALAVGLFGLYFFETSSHILAFKGLFSYNIILVLLALPTLFSVKWYHFVLAIIVTFIIEYLFHVPSFFDFLDSLGGILTIPFVVSGWIMMLLNKGITSYILPQKLEAQ